LPPFPRPRQTIKSYLRLVMRAAERYVHRREIKLLDALRLFVPNSSGDRTTIVNLTIQSAQQTFPFLAQLAAVYGDRHAKSFTSEDFWQNFGAPAAAETLRKMFNAKGSDKSTAHDYHYIYAPMLPEPPSVRNLLEIGLGTNNMDVVSNMGASGRPGASLRAFREFLPNASIYGADVDRRILFKEDRIRTFFVDQTDLVSFSELHSLDVKFDLIIDDGLHSPNANIAVILFGLTKLAPKGWLVVEDIGEAARPAWEVIASIPGPAYRCYLIAAKNALVFAIQKIG
jgi:hypothetical protein